MSSKFVHLLLATYTLSCVGQSSQAVRPLRLRPIGAKKTLPARKASLANEVPTSVRPTEETHPPAGVHDTSLHIRVAAPRQPEAHLAAPLLHHRAAAVVPHVANEHSSRQLPVLLQMGSNESAPVGAEHQEAPPSQALPQASLASPGLSALLRPSPPDVPDHPRPAQIRTRASILGLRAVFAVLLIAAIVVVFRAVSEAVAGAYPKRAMFFFRPREGLLCTSMDLPTSRSDQHGRGYSRGHSAAPHEMRKLERMAHQALAESLGGE